MSVELLRRADVVSLLELAGCHPRHRLGQNFVIDPGTIRGIVNRAGIIDGDRVLEVGPGLGSLTLGLLEAGAEVTCIEKDPTLARLLPNSIAARAPGLSVEVVCGDALSVDLSSVVGDGPWKLVANLPYNVATQVVLRVLDEAPTVETMVVMVQREVGERMAAAPGSRIYGIPSVLIGLAATARLSVAVPAEVFYPRPRVASSLVVITRLSEPLVQGVAADKVRRLVRQGFNQRRKTMRRSLGLSPECFAAAGIDASARPEMLSPQDWCRLAEAS
ncbi:MAG: 16S rRNA (adenine(1518)-N(6)/adenine(1519)-N(6))-dimethyltransferase RsmA [Microthrixaceae bacterium]|nr:16S rRNA (adenine(1518)-N(6)/adenine(1519)-N(6))-dimethyltransferase RsmA [Microthrixaceae bacterium]